jgi:hypothetical protein
MRHDEDKQTWWQTLPGVIAGVTAAITAVAGLVVAVKQTGWFSSQQRPAMTEKATSMSTAPSGPAAVTPAQERVAGASSRSVALPGMREYTLGSLSFTLLKAELVPQTTEKNALRIQVRMMNHQTYPANFWDDSFRLIVDGVPAAPQGGLNELVPGQSAKDGNVVFVIPRDTAAAKLLIRNGNDSTEVPLDMASAH